MRSVAIGILVVLPAARVFADAPPPAPVDAVVPAAEGLVFDGKLDEEAWKTALVIPAEPMGDVKPEVKVLVGGGCLWVSARVPEDPGFAMGLRWMICPDKTASAADCVALSYAPQDLRGPEFVARGPRGEGRKVYRFDGRADIAQNDLWTVETCLPLADLGLSAPGAPIRLAVIVTGRTPNRFSDAPRDSAFRSPTAFALLKPPAGGWESNAASGQSSDPLATREAKDRERLAAWEAYLAAKGAPVAADSADRALAPLGRAIAARPDLVMLRIEMSTRFMLARNAADMVAQLEVAREMAPHLPELEWQFVRYGASFQALSPVGGGSDYEDGLKYLALSSEGMPPEFVSITQGRLRFRMGEFGEAARLLEPWVKTHAFELDLVETYRWAKEWASHWGQELALRKAAAQRAELPQVRLHTKKGSVLVELFEDDAPNTVKNFVWLAEQHAYDGARVQDDETFRRVTIGEPKPARTRWAIRTELNKRKPFRGTLAMMNQGFDTEWATFFFTTGTLPEVDGSLTVFGRVLEGQDVVERLTVDDEIQKSEVVRKRPGTEYRPTTVAGEPAPKPR